MFYNHNIYIQTVWTFEWGMRIHETKSLGYNEGSQDFSQAHSVFWGPYVLGRFTAVPYFPIS